MCTAISKGEPAPATVDAISLKDPGSGLEILEGQMVQTGTHIGRVGMTGRTTTGPHFHWGIKYGKDWIDPALVLRAMYSSRS